MRAERIAERQLQIVGSAGLQDQFESLTVNLCVEPTKKNADELILVFLRLQSRWSSCCRPTEACKNQVAFLMRAGFHPPMISEFGC